MGLQLSKGQNEGSNAIHIHGTDIELTSVYVRIEFVAHADGTTIDVTFKTYLDHAHYLSGDCVHTDIHVIGFDFVVLETAVPLHAR